MVLYSFFIVCSVCFLYDISCSLENLQHLFGERWGKQLWEFAHGRDRRRVEPPSRPKSISSETTYEHDQPSWEAVWPNIKQFVVDMERRLDRWSLSARTVTLKVRFQDFTTITRSHTPLVPVRQADEIMRVARKLVERVPLDGRRIRLVGLGGSNLIRPGEPTSRPDDGSPRQLGLFAPSTNIPSEDSSA